MGTEKLLHVVEEDFQPTCACASRKCGPHHHWLPKALGGALLVSLVYAIVMHSFQIAERAEMRGTFVDEVRAEAMADAKAEAALTTQEVLTQWDARIKSSDSQVAERLIQAEALLTRATLLNWVLATPELERDMQFKQALEALQQRR